MLLKAVLCTLLTIFLASHRTLLEGDPVFVVPEVFDELSGRRVITMELVNGVPLDSCVDLNQETRNEVSFKQRTDICSKLLFDLFIHLLNFFFYF